MPIWRSIAIDFKKQHNLASKIQTGDTLLLNRLRPLLQGETVALTVTSKKQRRKKRIGEPVLIMVPLRQIGQSNGLMVGLQGFGCEFIEWRNIKGSSLIQIGLPAVASRKLEAALKALYVESKGSV